VNGRINYQNEIKRVYSILQRYVEDLFKQNKKHQ